MIIDRHGWGCAPDPAKAVTFLTKAASNAAVVENMALLAGQKKGGAAKGELVLAIFELANCFRNGWGIPKDAVAAKHVRRLFFQVYLHGPKLNLSNLILSSRGGVWGFPMQALSDGL